MTYLLIQKHSSSNPKQFVNLNWPGLIPTYGNRSKNSSYCILKWFPYATVFHWGPWRSLPNIIHLPIKYSHGMCIFWSSESPFFNCCLITSWLLNTSQIKIIWKSLCVSLNVHLAWEIEVSGNLVRNFSISILVSLPIFKNIWIFIMITFFQYWIIS